MEIELTGSAGTGEKILQNWDMFYYELDESGYEENRNNGCPHIYPFRVKFGTQKGYMSIVIENKMVSSSTTIDCGFSRPLGAYNDTTDFKNGLYKVAKKILKEYKIEIE